MARLTVVGGRAPGHDPFSDHPLLRGRMWVPDELPTETGALEQLWTALFKFRYVAALVAGDDPLAEARFRSLHDLRDRIEKAMGHRPFVNVAEEQWIASEYPGYGMERQVEAMLDDEDIPEELRLEHIPTYSSGGKLLWIAGATAMLPDEPRRLLTVEDWRRARSRRIDRSIAYRYYGSGWSARDDVRKYVLLRTWREMVARYRSLR